MGPTLTGTGHTVGSAADQYGVPHDVQPLTAPYLAFGTAVNALNACADAMAQARKGDWDGFESALTRLDDAQLGVFVDYYGERNHVCNLQKRRRRRIGSVFQSIELREQQRISG